MSSKKGTPETLTLKPSEVRQAIQVMAKTDISFFLWGPPGIAKSAVMRQIADEQNRPFIDIRLSQMDPTDLRGIPYPTEEEINGHHIKGMRWSAPLVLPRDPDSNAFIALEEFNSAPQTVQAAAYQLILDRRLGEYVVPKNCIIGAAGNRETDKGITFKMATPIANRFVHMEMKVDFNDFLVHALERRFHKFVIGYLSAFKNHLFVFDPASATRGFPTPRTWEFVSKLLTASHDMPEAVMMGLIAGAVGDGVGVQFLEHTKLADELPKNDDILSGRMRKFPNGKKPEVALCYALTTALCFELDDKAKAVKANGVKKHEREKWLEEADNYLEFMLANFPPEICIMAAKQAIAVHKLPFDTVVMKHFDHFARIYRDFIMATLTGLVVTSAAVASQAFSFIGGLFS